MTPNEPPAGRKFPLHMDLVEIDRLVHSQLVLQVGFMPDAQMIKMIMHCRQMQHGSEWHITDWY